MYAQDSIDLLTRSGIDFKRHQENGIDVAQFGELLMSSGVVLCDSVKWITFHSGTPLLVLLFCNQFPHRCLPVSRSIS
jgi:CCR4-NOT transcription complex subunit 7/8